MVNPPLALRGAEFVQERCLRLLRLRCLSFAKRSKRRTIRSDSVGGFQVGGVQLGDGRCKLVIGGTLFSD